MLEPHRNRFSNEVMATAEMKLIASRTHRNVIFDILEHSAFQKYSICWVFRAFFCSTFFYMYFANQPRPALTAVRHEYDRCIQIKAIVTFTSKSSHMFDFPKASGNPRIFFNAVPLPPMLILVSNVPLRIDHPYCKAGCGQEGGRHES